MDRKLASNRRNHTANVRPCSRHSRLRGKERMRAYSSEKPRNHHPKLCCRAWSGQCLWSDVDRAT
eukprot:15456792-Alexandrium_andersonii.AAC.1